MRSKRRFIKRINEPLLLLGRITFVVIAAFPFLWMVLTSLKPIGEIFRFPLQWFPETWTFVNYISIFNEKAFLKAVFNSLILATGVSLFSIPLALLAAFGFDRYRFRGRGALLFSILSFQFFPLAVFLLPYYFLLNRFNLIDSLWGLFLSYLPLALPLSLWMLISFIKQVPRALEEAALIDGCSEIGALFRITLPTMRPQIISTFLLAFVIIWEEYMLASIFTSSAATRVLPVHLQFYVREMITDWGQLMAASVVMTLPLVFPFIALSRYFQSGLTEGSLKG